METKETGFGCGVFRLAWCLSGHSCARTWSFRKRGSVQGSPHHYDLHTYSLSFLDYRKELVLGTSGLSDCPGPGGVRVAAHSWEATASFHGFTGRGHLPGLRKWTQGGSLGRSAKVVLA